MIALAIAAWKQKGEKGAKGQADVMEQEDDQKDKIEAEPASTTDIKNEEVEEQEVQEEDGVEEWWIRGPFIPSLQTILEEEEEEEAKETINETLRDFDFDVDDYFLSYHVKPVDDSIHGDCVENEETCAEIFTGTDEIVPMRQRPRALDTNDLVPEQGLMQDGRPRKRRRAISQEQQQLLRIEEEGPDIPEAHRKYYAISVSKPAAYSAAKLWDLYSKGNGQQLSLLEAEEVTKTEWRSRWISKDGQEMKATVRRQP
jgi:hypothetical protein